MEKPSSGNIQKFPLSALSRGSTGGHLCRQLREAEQEVQRLQLKASEAASGETAARTELRHKAAELEGVRSEMAAVKVIVMSALFRTSLSFERMASEGSELNDLAARGKMDLSVLS